MEFSEHQSEFVYEPAKPLGIELLDQSEDELDEMTALADAVQKLSWKDARSAFYFGGWLAIAPICGVLDWRPHIWVTAPAGAVKSWLAENVARPLLGDIALHTQGDTTEAGLHQCLGNDARPVVFDEFDSDNQRNEQRRENVLRFARSASSRTSARSYKGTPSGTAQSYTPQSCIVVFGVNVPNLKRADAERWTILEMKKLTGTDREKAHDDCGKLLNLSLHQDGFAERFRARLIRMAPTILANARAFGKVIRGQSLDQRIGDQFGALLAGFHSLVSDGTLTEQQAKDWLAEHKFDFSEHQPDAIDSDEQRALAVLLEAQIAAMKQ
jgi:putative DNA primase/helicase